MAADLKVWLSLSILMLVPLASADFLWTETNCPATLGNITDSLCCGETFCGSFHSESDCHSGRDDAALYCVWKGDKCSAVADRKSNVCCRGEGMNSCASILDGKCPEAFQVKKECCDDAEFNKFGFLKTADDDELVCCNAPCTAMERANCPLTDQCAPSKRSFGLHHPFQAHGFYPHYGYGGFDHKYGRIYRHGFRRRGRHGRRGGGKGKKHHDVYEDDHVPEITVDDLMLTLVDLLEKESDVKVYDADITSDPYLGKTKSGGLFVDHSFPDPERIIDEIYGEPRYYDYGWPDFGYLPPPPPYGFAQHGPYAWSGAQGYGAPYGDHGQHYPFAHYPPVAPHQGYAAPDQHVTPYPAPPSAHYPQATPQQGYAAPDQTSYPATPAAHYPPAAPQQGYAVPDQHGTSYPAPPPPPNAYPPIEPHQGYAPPEQHGATYPAPPTPHGYQATPPSYNSALGQYPLDALGLFKYIDSDFPR